MSVLKNLMVDTKAAWVEYPGMRGFEVEVVNLSRPQLIALRKRCVVSKMDRRSKMVIETLDEDKFLAEFTAATIKNWKGLTFGALEQLILIEVPADKLDEEVPYSQEDAELLVKNSQEFDTWINETVFDLENFRTERD